MSTDGSLSDHRGVKPESVIINAPQETEVTLPNAPQPQDKPVMQYNESIDSRTRRLELATILFSVSMFLYWGYAHWQVWYLDLLSVEYYYYDEYRPETGFSEIILTLEYLVLDMWLFDHYTWIAQEAGFLVLLIVIMRDFMPMVFIGLLIACWSNKTKAPSFYEKISIFAIAYFTIMAGFLIYSVIYQMLYFEHAEDLIFGIFFDAIGFWLAGIAVVLIHPRIIPLPENLALRSKSFLPNIRQYSESVADIPITNESDGVVNLGKLALFYFPLVYLIITIISVVDGGDDDALCMGIALPMVGFFAGISVYRTEFLKGFGAHLAYSMGYAFVGYLLVLIGFIGNLEDEIFLIIMATLTMPIVLHLKQNHVRALGSAYSIPFSVFIIMIGLIMGYIQIDGL